MIRRKALKLAAKENLLSEVINNLPIIRSLAVESDRIRHWRKVTILRRLFKMSRFNLAVS